MKMKPILFNTDMVRGLLNGTKTATRRVVKGYALDHLEIDTDGSIIGVYDQDEGHVFPIMDYAPYHPGDILYVRETFCWCPCWDCGMNIEEGCCDEIAEKVYNTKKSEWGCYGYKASFAENEAPFDKWTPSIHMPREAARIFLRVTDVRVERLQKMRIADFKAEGIIRRRPKDLPGHGCDCAWKHDGCLENPCANRDAYEYMCWDDPFSEEWDSTIKPADRALYGWAANPWVWVIEFERISGEEAAP